MIETNVYAVLQAQPAIVAIVGTSIFPVVLPENAKLPAITYQIVASVSRQTQATAGMQRLRLQVDCWSTTYLAAITLREVVAASLDGYRDTNLSALLLSKVDQYEDATRVFRALIEFYIFTTLY